MNHPPGSIEVLEVASFRFFNPSKSVMNRSREHAASCFSSCFYSSYTDKTGEVEVEHGLIVIRELLPSVSLEIIQLKSLFDSSCQDGVILFCLNSGAEVIMNITYSMMSFCSMTNFLKPEEKKFKLWHFLTSKNLENFLIF